MGRGPTAVIEDEAQWATGEIVVYQLRFDDGKIYTGITKDIRNRLGQHRQKNSPAKLLAQLKTGVPYKCVIVWKCDDRQDAIEMEQGCIDLVADAFNLNSHRFQSVGVGSNRRPGRKNYRRIDDSRATRCSWCRQIKQAIEYNSDKSRSSGLMSRCKDCLKEWNRERWRAIRDGRSVSAAYYATKKKTQARLAGVTVSPIRITSPNGGLKSRLPSGSSVHITGSPGSSPKSSHSPSVK